MTQRVSEYIGKNIYFTLYIYTMQEQEIQEYNNNNNFIDCRGQKAHLSQYQKTTKKQQQKTTIIVCD